MGIQGVGCDANGTGSTDVGLSPTVVADSSGAEVDSSTVGGHVDRAGPRTPVSLGTDFASRRNSLNAIRLALSLLVIVSHAGPLGGFGDEPRIGHTTLGTIAVAFFFAISGVLITSSRQRTTGGRYLWHRALRILPGWWMCLVLIAAVAAPLAWSRYHGTLAGFPVASAAKYVAINGALIAHGYPTIVGTQSTIPLELRGWNGSAWSLTFEALCYLAVAILAWCGALRVVPVAIVTGIGALTLLLWEVGFDPVSIVMDDIYYARRLITTGTVFASAALVWLLRHSILASRKIAAGCAVVTAGALILLEHPHWLVGAPIAYLIMWGSTRIRQPRVLGKADLSYGTYIYAYPVAMLLTIYGVNDIGLLVHLGATLVLTLALAVASWFGIERPAMRWKDVGRRRELRAAVPRPLAHWSRQRGRGHPVALSDVHGAAGAWPFPAHAGLESAKPPDRAPCVEGDDAGSLHQVPL